MHLGKRIGHTAVRNRYVSIEIVNRLSDFTRVVRLERSSFDVILDQYYRGRNTESSTHLNLNIKIDIGKMCPSLP